MCERWEQTMDDMNITKINMLRNEDFRRIIEDELKTTKDRAIPSWNFTIPAKMDAIFYFETKGGSNLSVLVVLYIGTEQASHFTVTPAYPYLSLQMNPNDYPVPYTLSAGVFDPSWRWLNVNETGLDLGYEISVPTGETDQFGRPVAQVIYMQIAAHPSVPSIVSHRNTTSDFKA
jgi:hypothetical protein